MAGMSDGAACRSGSVIDVDGHAEGGGLDLTGVDGDRGVASYD